MLIDSHCHLDFNDFDEDFDEIMARAREAGVTAMLNAGNNINELDRQLALSETYPFIYTAVGVHPHNAAEYPDIKAADFVEKSHHKKVVAIGECGLDYYYDYSPPDIQKKIFIEQIIAAQQTGLPLIIHTRDADDDTIAILDEYYKKHRSAEKYIVSALLENWPNLPFPSVFISLLPVLLLLTNPENCATFSRMFRWNAFWSKPIRRFWRLFRCAAAAMSLRLSVTRPNAWRS